jgi:hypothetical protein
VNLRSRGCATCDVAQPPRFSSRRSCRARASEGS